MFSWITTVNDPDAGNSPLANYKLVRDTDNSIPLYVTIYQNSKSMGPTWGPPGSCRPQMDPMLAPWTLLLR